MRDKGRLGNRWEYEESDMNSTVLWRFKYPIKNLPVVDRITFL